MIWTPPVDANLKYFARVQPYMMDFHSSLSATCTFQNNERPEELVEAHAATSSLLSSTLSPPLNLVSRCGPHSLSTLSGSLGLVSACGRRPSVDV